MQTESEINLTGHTGRFGLIAKKNQRSIVLDNRSGNNFLGKQDSLIVGRWYDDGFEKRSFTNSVFLFFAFQHRCVEHVDYTFSVDLSYVSRSLWEIFRYPRG